VPEAGSGAGGVPRPGAVPGRKEKDKGSLMFLKEVSEMEAEERGGVAEKGRGAERKGERAREKGSGSEEKGSGPEDKGRGPEDKWRGSSRHAQLSTGDFNLVYDERRRHRRALRGRGGGLGAPPGARAGAPRAEGGAPPARPGPAAPRLPGRTPERKRCLHS